MPFFFSLRLSYSIPIWDLRIWTFITRKNSRLNKVTPILCQLCRSSRVLCLDKTKFLNLEKINFSSFLQQGDELYSFFPFLTLKVVQSPLHKYFKMATILKYLCCGSWTTFKFLKPFILTIYFLNVKAKCISVMTCILRRTRKKIQNCNHEILVIPCQSHWVSNIHAAFHQVSVKDIFFPA